MSTICLSTGYIQCAVCSCLVASFSTIQFNNFRKNFLQMINIFNTFSYCYCFPEFSISSSFDDTSIVLAINFQLDYNQEIRQEFATRSHDLL